MACISTNRRHYSLILCLLLATVFVGSHHGDVAELKHVAQEKHWLSLVSYFLASRRNSLCFVSNSRVINSKHFLEYLPRLVHPVIMRLMRRGGRTHHGTKRQWRRGRHTKELSGYHIRTYPGLIEIAMRSPSRTMLSFWRAELLLCRQMAAAVAGTIGPGTGSMGTLRNDACLLIFTNQKYGSARVHLDPQDECPCDHGPPHDHHGFCSESLRMKFNGRPIPNKMLWFRSLDSQGERDAEHAALEWTKEDLRKETAEVSPLYAPARVSGNEPDGGPSKDQRQ